MMSCWVADRKAAFFLSKKGDNESKKGYNSTREKQGIPLCIWAKKGHRRIFNTTRHTLAAVCSFFTLNIRGVPFFRYRPKYCHRNNPGDNESTTFKLVF